jgi:hypothetical protein
VEGGVYQLFFHKGGICKIYAKTTSHRSPSSSLVVLKTLLEYPCYVLAAVTGAAQL